MKKKVLIVFFVCFLALCSYVGYVVIKYDLIPYGSFLDFTTRKYIKFYSNNSNLFHLVAAGLEESEIGLEIDIVDGNIRVTDERTNSGPTVEEQILDVLDDASKLLNTGVTTIMKTPYRHIGNEGAMFSLHLEDSSAGYVVIYSPNVEPDPIRILKLEDNWYLLKQVEMYG